VKITDPGNLLLPHEFDEVSKKIRRGLGAMLSPVAKTPGNPFFYSYAVTKPHKIRNLSPHATACTDANSFSWHPSFITKLTDFETAWVLCHEILHVLYDHVFILNFKKGSGLCYNKNIANVAMDFVNNGVLEQDMEERSVPKTSFRFVPVSLEELKENWTAKEPKPKPETEEQPYLLDPTLYKKSWIEIYRDLFEFCEKKAPEQLKAPSYYLVDGHDWDEAIKESGLDPEDIRMDMQRAFESARNIGRNLPSYIGDAIGELYNPIIDLKDYMKLLHLKRKKVGGKKNNWSRFSKRFISDDIYLPTKMKPCSGHYVTVWDVSGSVSDDELKFGLSQFKSLRDWTGDIIPVDDQALWANRTSIKSVADLKRTKVVGRGGTNFDSFFKEFWQNIRTPVDCIAVVTDGHVFPPSQDLDPGIPTVWVVFTREGYDNLQLNFGTKVLLSKDIYL